MCQIPTRPWVSTMSLSSLSLLLRVVVLSEECLNIKLFKQWQMCIFHHGNGYILPMECWTYQQLKRNCCNVLLQHQTSQLSWLMVTKQCSTGKVAENRQIHFPCTKVLNSIEIISSVGIPRQNIDNKGQSATLQASLLSKPSHRLQEEHARLAQNDGQNKKRYSW